MSQLRGGKVVVLHGKPLLLLFTSVRIEAPFPFQFSIGSYAVCGVASFMAGFAGSAVCNVATTPRSIECYLNTYQNCYRQDCGMVNLDFF